MPLEMLDFRNWRRAAGESDKWKRRIEDVKTDFTYSAVDDDF